MIDMLKILGATLLLAMSGTIVWLASEVQECQVCTFEDLKR